MGAPALLAAVVVLAAGAPVAKDGPGVISYPVTYFTPAEPATAFDIVLRVPGFTYDRG